MPSFGLKPLTLAERLDLLELLDDRHGRRSTLVTSQLPIAHWHAYHAEDPTVADAFIGPPLESPIDSNARVSLCANGKNKTRKSLTLRARNSK